MIIDKCFTRYFAHKQPRNMNISFSFKLDPIRAFCMEINLMVCFPGLIDSITLFFRYLYLIFSDDDLISLDEFVFNTEAHPMRVEL